jgi:hypothetical protein
VLRKLRPAVIGEHESSPNPDEVEMQLKTPLAAIDVEGDFARSTSDNLSESPISQRATALLREGVRWISPRSLQEQADFSPTGQGKEDESLRTRGLAQSECENVLLGGVNTLETCPGKLERTRVSH